jgi:hypothetical protein
MDNQRGHEILPDYDSPIPEGMFKEYDVTIGKWIVCGEEERWEYGRDAMDSSTVRLPQFETAEITGGAEALNG